MKACVLDTSAAVDTGPPRHVGVETREPGVHKIGVRVCWSFRGSDRENLCDATAFRRVDGAAVPRIGECS